MNGRLGDFSECCLNCFREMGSVLLNAYIIVPTHTSQVDVKFFVFFIHVQGEIHLSNLFICERVKYVVWFSIKVWSDFVPVAAATVDLFL